MATDAPARAPVFTVGMPVYNHQAFVAEAIRSVLDQDFRDFELIIVDDGSTDASPGIIDDFARRDPRIRVIHQANAGVQRARNTIVSHARAPWLTWLDSDDVWYKETLSRYAAYIASHGEVRFIHGSCDKLDAQGHTAPGRREFQDHVTGAPELFGRMYLSHLCVCYRRELFDQAGGYDPATLYADDYDLYLRLSLTCRFEPLGAPTGLRRRHPGCMSAISGRSRMFEAEVLRRFAEQRGGKDLLPPRQVRRRLEHLYCSAAEQYVRAGFFRQALTAVRSALRYRTTLKCLGFALAALCLLPFSRTPQHPIPRLG